MDNFSEDLHIAMLTIAYLQCEYRNKKEPVMLNELEFLQEYKKSEDIITLLYPTIIGKRESGDKM